MKTNRTSQKTKPSKKAKSKPSLAPKTEQRMADGQMHLDYMLPIVELELQSMAAAAAKGDRNAVSALHRIAVKAVGVLNDLPMALKQHEAKASEWWPINLSWVPSWNRVNVVALPEELGLGKAVNSVIDLEAVLKRGAPSNILGSYLVIYVEECRRFGVIVRRLKQNALETSSKVLAPDEEQSLVHAFNWVRHITRAVATFMNRDLPRLTQDRIDAVMSLTIKRAEAALELRPLLESKDSRKAWFAFAMEVVEEFSDGRYDLPEFGLSAMNRKNVIHPGQIRAGIRQGIQEGFMAVIANVSADGFVVVE